MALRGTLTHRKTRRLANALKVSQAHALGLLEALWHVTAEQQPDGGIGRMSDQDIADEMFHDGDAGELIRALIRAEWLEESDSCRLYVHDWHIHADDSIHSKLIQWTRLFAARAHGVHGAPPRLRKLSSDARERVIHRYENRYGAFIGEIMRCVRTVGEIAHDAPDAHIQSQSPEPESRARVQSPDERTVVEAQDCMAQTEPPTSVRPSPEKSRQPRPDVRRSSGPPIQIPEAKPIAPPPTPRPPGRSAADIAEMQRQLHSFMSCSGTRQVPAPDDALIVRCFVALGDTPMSAVVDWFHRRYQVQSPRHPNGPKGYAWFPPVLAQAFGGAA